MNPTSVKPVSINTYFPTLQAFNELCRQDKRLNPPSQLLFRLLMEQANRNRWTDTFLLSIPDIESITHMSRPTIVKARQQLKNLGLIDFNGKPSRYTVYCLVNNKLNNAESPTPPIKIPKYNTKRKRKEKEKEVRENEQPTLTESDTARLNALINERIAALENPKPL